MSKEQYPSLESAVQDKARSCAKLYRAILNSDVKSIRAAHAKKIMGELTISVRNLIHLPEIEYYETALKLYSNAYKILEEISPFINSPSMKA